MSLKIKNPKSKILIFSNGNLIINGTKTLKQTHEAINQLEIIGFKIKTKPKVIIQNTSKS